MTKKELDDKYDADLAELQKNCPHKESDWYEEVWAPGHSLGTQALVCKNCEATIDRKGSNCMIESKLARPLTGYF